MLSSLYLLAAPSLAATSLQEFVESYPDPLVVGACASVHDYEAVFNRSGDYSADMPADELPALHASRLLDAGVDPSAPVYVALVKVQGRFAWVVEAGDGVLGLDITDDIAPSMARVPDSMRAADGSLDGERFLPPELLAELMPRIEPQQGCNYATGHLGPPGGWKALADGVLGVLIETPVDRKQPVRLHISGLKVHGSLSGEPARRSRGRSTWDAPLQLRLNMDPEALLATQADKPKVAGLAQMLEEHEVDLAPGVELGIGFDEDLVWSLVIPLERPRLARAVPRRVAARMEQEGETVEFSQGVLKLPGERAGYMSATRRSLVISNTHAGALTMRRRQGQRWFTGPYARWSRQPGVYVALQGEGLAGLLEPIVAMSGQAPPDMPTLGDAEARLWVTSDGVLMVEAFAPTFLPERP